MNHWGLMGEMGWKHCRAGVDEYVCVCGNIGVGMGGGNENMGVEDRLETWVMLEPTLQYYAIVKLGNMFMSKFCAQNSCMAWV